MNNLSWLLYFTSVFDSLRFFAGLFAFIACIVVVIYICVELEGRKKPKLGWGVLPLMLGLIAIVTPPKDTMYAIAASEMGQKVYESDVGQKTKLAIEAWLDKQITKNK